MAAFRPVRHEWADRSKAARRILPMLISRSMKDMQRQAKGRNAMTRRNRLILVTVLVSVFTFGPIGPVSACELNASDRCVQVAATDAAALYAAIAPLPFVRADGLVSVLSDMP